MIKTKKQTKISIKQNFRHSTSPSQAKPQYNLKYAKNRDEQCTYMQMLSFRATIALKYHRMRKAIGLRENMKKALMAFMFH